MKPLRNPIDIFDGVPGPSPWFLRSNPPRVNGFDWKQVGEESLFAGKTMLVGRQGPVAIFDFHHYVSLANDALLLIWHQPHVESGPNAPVRIIALDPHALAPLDKDLKTACRSMQDGGIPLLYDGPTIATVDLDTTTVAEDLNVSFPVPLADIQELLMLCHSSGVTPEPGWERSNLALLVAHPSGSSYRLYPQDWFNNAGLDYGYQWVTRVARHPSTRRIHGEGIRIAPFVLDDTLRARVPDAAH